MQYKQRIMEGKRAVKSEDNILAMLNVEMHSTLNAFLQTQTSKVDGKEKNLNLKMCNKIINYEFYVLEHFNRIGAIQ